MSPSVTIQYLGGGVSAESKAATRAAQDPGIRYHRVRWVISPFAFRGKWRHHVGGSCNVGIPSEYSPGGPGMRCKPPHLRRHETKDNLFDERALLSGCLINRQNLNGGNWERWFRAVVNRPTDQDSRGVEFPLREWNEEHLGLVSERISREKVKHLEEKSNTFLYEGAFQVIRLQFPDQRTCTQYNSELEPPESGVRVPSLTRDAEGEACIPPCHVSSVDSGIEALETEYPRCFGYEGKSRRDEN
ncbi:hypothetical protein B0H13DRAFT_1890676 [Mycena leptocephala]|nr:hypothetical protein B0H13DRAFT_1890676 [Mycena leptocephala]